jgi:hypothetical protein
MSSTGAVKSVFVSGAQWVPRGYFDRYYRPALQRYLDAGCAFIVGGAPGVDAFAQEMLRDALPDAAEAGRRVRVYNKATQDGRASPHFGLVNGFESYPARDAQALRDADEFFCVLPQFGGGQSGVMLSVLEATETCTDGASALEFIRRRSEPFESALVQRVAAVYADFYGNE